MKESLYQVVVIIKESEQDGRKEGTGPEAAVCMIKHKI